MVINTTFWDTSAFWKWIDEDIKRRWADLEEVSEQVRKAQEELWQDQSSIRAGVNKEFIENLTKSKADVKDIGEEFRTSVGERRTQAEGLVKRQEAAAWLEANIAAAAASKGWRLSVWQLWAINKDITNQFATSINNAIKDNINFQTSLDEKLSTFWLSIVDKNRVLDEFKKVLVDEETAPLLDAIASQAKTKIDFITKLWLVIEWMHKSKADAASWARARESRIESEQRAFDVMNTDQRTRYLSDKMWPTWNVLSAWQKNSLIKKASQWGVSLTEINDIIQNMKDKAEQAKLIQQQATAWSEEDAAEALLETWIQTTWPQTFTSGTAANDEALITTTDDVPITGSTASTLNPEPNGYKVWNVTYTSKNDYNLIKKAMGKLNTLRASDPTRFKAAIDLIKKKYIIS